MKFGFFLNGDEAKDPFQEVSGSKRLDYFCEIISISVLPVTFPFFLPSYYSYNMKIPLSLFKFRKDRFVETIGTGPHTEL